MRFSVRDSIPDNRIKMKEIEHFKVHQNIREELRIIGLKKKGIMIFGAIAVPIILFLFSANSSFLLCIGIGGGGIGGLYILIKIFQDYDFDNLGGVLPDRINN